MCVLFRVFQENRFGEVLTNQVIIGCVGVDVVRLSLQTHTLSYFRKISSNVTRLDALRVN